MRVGISGDFMASILTLGVDPGLRVIKGLPPGARYVRCFDDGPKASTIWLAFEHESFEEVRSGAPIPILEVVIGRRLQ